MIVRKAKNSDLLLIQKLLAKAGVREEGIEDHIEHFLVVINDRNELIGTIGMEKYEEEGLFRSFVIDSNEWDAQLSLQFLSVALQYAKEQDVMTIYLCTKGTNRLFHKLGFKKIPFEEVPPTIKESAHFRTNVTTEMNVWSYCFE